MAGESNSIDGDVTNLHGQADLWVVKTDSSGNIQWQKTLGGSDQEWYGDIIQTLDGGFAVVGLTYSNDGDVSGHHGAMTPQYRQDGWMVKLDSTGTIEWQKILGGTKNDRINDIIQLNDGSYILCAGAQSFDGEVTGHLGSVSSANGMDFWLVKLDLTGNIIWEKCYGGSGGEEPYSVIQASDGGFVLAGVTYSNDSDVTAHIGAWGTNDFWIIKTDSVGTLEWEKSLGGTYHDNAWSIIQSNDGGYVAVGNTQSNDSNVSVLYGNVDIWVVKIDSTGNLLWEKSLGGSLNDQAADLVRAYDGGYLVLGRVYSSDFDVSMNYGASDCWLAKLSETGALEWSTNYGGSLSEWVGAIIQTPDSNYAIAGGTGSNDFDVSGNHGVGDYWLLKINPDSLTSINNLDFTHSGFTLFPNPASDAISFSTSNNFFVEKILFYDVTGQLVLEKFVDYTSGIDISSLSPALYFYEAQSTKGESVYGKFLKQ